MTEIKINEHQTALVEFYDENCNQKWYTGTIDGKNGFLTEYRNPRIRYTAVQYGEHAENLKYGGSNVIVNFHDGTTAEWNSKMIGSYNSQFGISVSNDGSLVFAQTWDRGLFALDAQSGITVWQTESKKGITSLYVNAETVLAFQHEKALQLLDIGTGTVIKEKKPAVDWGFRILKDGFILCQTTARKWEIIRTDDLETVETIPAKKFPQCCIQRIVLSSPDTISVHGFVNRFDETTVPPVMLPNVLFDETIKLENTL